MAIYYKHQQRETDMTKQANYRGFSIEIENDGTYSIYRFGYIKGGLKTVEQAKIDINNRLD